MGWILLVLLVTVVLLAAAMFFGEGRLAALTGRFRAKSHAAGSELADSGHRAAADVWPLALPPVAQARYSERWRRSQLRFVYDPAGSVREADGLVDEVLRQLGYEPGHIEAGDGRVPVAPELLADYVARAFHRAGRSDSDVGMLREAFVRDRALFDQLVAATAADRSTPRTSGQR